MFRVQMLAICVTRPIPSCPITNYSASTTSTRIRNYVHHHHHTTTLPSSNSVYTNPLVLRKFFTCASYPAPVSRIVIVWVDVGWCREFLSKFLFDA